MLSEGLFLKGIQQLGEYYKNFSLTKEESATWYKTLAHLNEIDFKETLIDFMKSSTYAPQNPTHLLNPLGARIIDVPDWLRELKRNRLKEHQLRLTQEEKEPTIEEVQALIDSFKK